MLGHNEVKLTINHIRIINLTDGYERSFYGKRPQYLCRYVIYFPIIIFLVCFSSFFFHNAATHSMKPKVV